MNDHELSFKPFQLYTHSSVYSTIFDILNLRNGEYNSLLLEFWSVITFAVMYRRQLCWVAVLPAAEHLSDHFAALNAKLFSQTGLDH